MSFIVWLTRFLMPSWENSSLTGLKTKMNLKPTFACNFSTSMTRTLLRREYLFIV